MAACRRKKSKCTAFPLVRASPTSPKTGNRRLKSRRACFTSLTQEHAAHQIWFESFSQLDIQLTVTVGRNEKLGRAIERASAGHNVDIYGWTDEMPRLLCENHVLIGKAGGATVQETIAAALSHDH